MLGGQVHIGESYADDGHCSIMTPASTRCRKAPGWAVMAQNR